MQQAKAGAGGRTRTGDLVVINDNPILRPVENAEGWTRDGFDVSGRESNPHLLVFTSCSDAVELPSSITKAQWPIRKGTTDKRRVGSSTGCPAAQDLNLLAVRAPLLPITQTQRPVGKTRWTRNDVGGGTPVGRTRTRTSWD